MRFVLCERQPVLRHPVGRASSAPSQHALRAGERLGRGRLELGAGHVTRGRGSPRACATAPPPHQLAGRAGWEAVPAKGTAGRPVLARAPYRAREPGLRDRTRLRWRPSGSERVEAVLGCALTSPGPAAAPTPTSELQDHGASALPSATPARRRSGGRARKSKRPCRPPPRRSRAGSCRRSAPPCHDRGSPPDAEEKRPLRQPPVVMLDFWPQNIPLQSDGHRPGGLRPPSRRPLLSAGVRQTGWHELGCFILRL